MKTMENIELFDDYIAGSLSPEQKNDFEARLKTDKSFASDFKIYLFTIDGVIKEAQQDNADFENAMHHLTKEELLRIIGKSPKKKTPGIFRFGYLRERAAWTAGVAALLIVCFVSVFFTWKVGNNNIDNMLVDYYYVAASRDGEEDIDISKMTTKEVEEYLPTLISDYENCDASDLQGCEEAGVRVALAYLKIHNRKEARMWLETLIKRFGDDMTFVLECERILDQID